MEPLATVEVSAARRSSPFTLGQVLAESWALWSHDALTILGVVLLLQVPVALLAPLPGGTSPGSIALGLLSSLVGGIVSLAQTGAITLAGLRAVRGEPLRVRGLATDGLRRTWLTFKVAVLSWWVVFVLLVIIIFVAVANFPALAMSPGEGGALFWFVPAGLGVGAVLVKVWYFPAVPVALSHPELGARSAVRRARGLTQGVRLRLLPLALGFECLSALFWALYHWATRLPEGRERAVAMIASGVLAAAIASFVNVGRVFVDRALRREREGAASDLDGLERVFE